MRTILQLSDFHIKSSMPSPGKNKVFVDLVEYLKSQNLEQTILVYNGDVIDSKSISASINSKLSKKEKAKIWEKEAHKAYNKAGKYFEYLITALSIPNDHIIICCGNHDVNPYYEGTAEVECPISEKEKLYNPKRFNQFLLFCKELHILQVDINTYFREIDGLGFLVVNSNWTDKWKDQKRENLCIACGQIRNIIDEHKKSLQTRSSKSKLLNIFVAHAPSTDYCDEALYRYNENSRTAVMESIDRHFGLKLYGDKHTDSIHSFDYIVGAPLDNDFITCGIHSFDGEFRHHHKTLIFSNNTWKTIGSEKDINKILKISVESIKGRALEYLFGTDDTSDLVVKIQNFEETRLGTNWTELDKLIRVCTDVQKPQPRGAGMPINVDDGFINTLTRLIADSTKKVCITLRGEGRLGKSVSMSLLYMNLLYGFISGTFDYMPVYINIEQILKQLGQSDRDSSGFERKFTRRITTILKKGIQIAKELQRPACCIIDGLNKYFIYNNLRIETIIATELGNDYGRQYSRIIHCIDTGNDTGLGLTPQHTQKGAEYVVYFNHILSQKMNSKKYGSFVKAYCRLKNFSDADILSNVVLDNIKRMQILEVDISLLNNFWDKLSIENDNTLFEIVEDFVHTHIAAISTPQLVNAANACYLYYSGGKSYAEITKHCGISNKTFELIRTQKLVMRYLLAANYVLSIQSVKGNNLHPCLNILYNHETCAFIRQYITKHDIQAQIILFAQSKYTELTFKGKATISYLVGRLNSENNIIVDILNQHESILAMSEVDKFNESSFYKSIAQRSVRLSKAFMEHDTCKCLREYISELIRDDYERKINRCFYLKFYGDRGTTPNDLILEGFDIYYTYNILASRLIAWRDYDKHYTLLDLELFTLCDLLQVRLDSPIAKSRDEKNNVDSFFYNSKFNKTKDDMTINVLKFIINIITHYLSKYGNDDENLLFNKYLTVQKKRFQNAVDKLECGPLNNNGFTPVDMFTKLSSLENEKRIGWNIPDVIPGILTEAQFQLIQNKRASLETVLQHTFEAYLIGLLYLPNSSKAKQGYNKQQILNMLLIHDFGESEIGDIIPQYEHYKQCRQLEREFCEELFLLGTHSYIADLTEYLYLWEAWCDGSREDDNILIAKEIDKIQMLYKLLVLLLEGKVILSKERIQNFWEARNMLKTTEGKEIFNILIARNKKLRDIAKIYNLPASELM